MKQIGILLVVALLVSCQTGPDVIPDNTPAVVDTQATVAAGAATIAAGAGNLETEAAGIAEVLGTLAQENPALAPVAAQAVAHAEGSKAHATEARKHEADVAKARLEVVAVLTRASRIEGLYHEERLGRVKAEGERNTARSILAGLIAIAAILIFLKFKRLIF